MLSLALMVCAFSAGDAYAFREPAITEPCVALKAALKKADREYLQCVMTAEDPPEDCRELRRKLDALDKKYRDSGCGRIRRNINPVPGDGPVPIF